MATSESTPLFTSANDSTFADHSTQASHWKQEKRDLNIDFEYLDKLLSKTIPKRDNEDSIFLKYEQQGERLNASNERFTHLCGRPASLARPKMTLHSSSLTTAFSGTELKDLLSTSYSLQEAFSQEWWLNFQNPSKSDLRHVCTAFGVHPLTVEDIWNQEPLEKIEQYPAYRFVCFQSFNEILEGHEISFKPFTVFLVIFSHGTVSFCFEQNIHCQNIEMRIALQGNTQALQSSWVFYSFADEIVDSFQPPIMRIGKAVSQIEDLVYTTSNSDAKTYLAHIAAIRKQVLSLMRLLAGKSQVLRGFKSHHTSTAEFEPDIILYINDTQDHVITMLETLNQFESLLFRAKANFMSQVQGRSYTRRSKIFKLLCRAAILNGLFTVGMCVAQAFGMNVSRKAKLFTGGSIMPWMVIAGTYMLLVVIFYRIAMRYFWTW